MNDPGKQLAVTVLQSAKHRMGVWIIKVPKVGEKSESRLDAFLQVSIAHARQECRCSG